MTVNMLKSKIHRATVKQAELQYVGSITIDEALMEAAGIFEGADRRYRKWKPFRDVCDRR